MLLQLLCFFGIVGICIGSPLSVEDDLFMQRQIPQNDVAHRLHLANISEYQGFTGIGLSKDFKSVEIWWKGTPGERAMKVIRALNSSKTPITILTAKFSKIELEELAVPLRQVIADSNNPFYAIQYPVNGSAITLEAEELNLANTTRNNNDFENHLPEYLQKLANRMKVPLKFRRGRRPKATGRYSDYPPFEGGIAICKIDRSRCTAGFSVRNNAGQRFLLTAGHCGNVGETFYACDAPNAVSTIGKVVVKNTEKDALLISANAISGKIWDGPLNNGEFTKDVVGWTSVSAGLAVCASGSTSGVLCRFLVRGVMDVCFTSGLCTKGLIYAERTGVTNKGDSGGPVFTLAGAGKVRAAGTVSGAQGDQIMYFSPFSDIVNPWNLQTLSP